MTVVVVGRPHGTAASTAAKSRPWAARLLSLRNGFKQRRPILRKTQDFTLLSARRNRTLAQAVDPNSTQPQSGRQPNLIIPIPNVAFKWTRSALR